MSDAPSHIGPFEVRERLGTGGMGVVYLAYDPPLDRLVAVKVLSVDDEEIRQRFLREARFAARVQHPNIVAIYAVGQHEGRPYMAMEYIAGDTLASIIRSDQPVAMGRRVQWLYELANGLEFAHRNGIVHRDVKPANLIVSRDSGLLRLLDFGIARDDDSDHTMAGHVIGTPSYMSPEQVTGGTVDARSDIFAFGLVAYELLSGVRAFQGANTYETTRLIVEGEPVSLATRCPELPSALVTMVHGCLAKSPEERPASLVSVRADLKRVLHRLDPVDEPSVVRTVVRPLATATLTPTTSTGDKQRRQQRRRQQIQSLVGRARQALDAGDLGAAIEAAEQADLFDDRTPELSLLLQDIHAERARRDVAARLQQVRAHIDQGDVSAAEQALSAIAPEVAPEDVPTLRDAIARMRLLQRVDRCAHDLQSLLRSRDPEAAERRLAAESGEVRGHPRIVELRTLVEAQRAEVEAEARRRAEEADARRRAEEEARRQAEEARRRAAEEARRRAEEEARRQAEEEARKRAKEEEEARRRAEEEAARRRAEEAEARRRAEEEEARRAAEARRLKEEADARQRAEEADARRRAEAAESQRRAEEEARRKAEEAEARRREAEAARARQREAEARQRAEAEARRRAAEEEAARRQAEEAEARRRETETQRLAETIVVPTAVVTSPAPAPAPPTKPAPAPPASPTPAPATSPTAPATVPPRSARPGLPVPLLAAGAVGVLLAGLAAFLIVGRDAAPRTDADPPPTVATDSTSTPSEPARPPSTSEATNPPPAETAEVPAVEPPAPNATTPTGTPILVEIRRLVDTGRLADATAHWRQAADAPDRDAALSYLLDRAARTTSDARAAADARGAGASPDYQAGRLAESRGATLAARRSPDATEQFTQATAAYARASAPPPPAPAPTADATRSEPPPSTNVTSTAPPSGPRPETSAPTNAPAPAPPVAAPDQRPAVLAALDAFAAAYNSRDVGAVAATWPGMPAEWRNSLTQSFRTFSSVDWTFTSRTVTVNGDTAQVLAAVTIKRTGSRGSPTSNQRYRFDLRRTAGTWVIQGVTLQ